MSKELLKTMLVILFPILLFTLFHLNRVLCDVWDSFKDKMAKRREDAKQELLQLSDKISKSEVRNG